MKKKAITLFLIPFILSSCASLKSLDTNKIAGLYQGIIPCADCEGIKTSLTISPDYTYQKSSIYLGKAINLFKSSGSWKTKNDSTITLNENGIQQQYLINPSKLILLDQKGKNIKGSFTEKNELLKIEQDISVEGDLSKQKEKGTHFFASGNEPFWSAEIMADKSVNFNLVGKKTMSFKDISTSYKNGITIIKNNSGKTPLEVVIYDFPCVNDMSGLISGNYVTVKINNTVYEGCGSVVNPDYKLSGNWNLKYLKDVNLKSLKGKKTLYIHFDISQKQVNGNFGCNNFGGNYELSDNYISFSKLISTKMACPNLSIETKYAEAMQYVNSYKIVNNELQFYKDQELLLSFVR